MPLTNSNNRIKTIKCSSSFARTTPVSKILETDYSLPKKNTVPAGSYVSTIIDIRDSVTKSDDAAIDVLYDLQDALGNEYNIFLRYPLSSSHVRALTKNLVSEGIVKNYLADAIGAVEDITITYDDKDSIGSITSRSQHRSTAPTSKHSLGGRKSKSMAPSSSRSAVAKELKESLLDDDLDEIEDVDDDIVAEGEDFDDFLEDEV